MNDRPGLPTASTADLSAAPVDVSTRAGPDSPSAATQSEIDLPADVAGYRLLGEIARGGMGAVHRATDTALGRGVAVIVLLDKSHAESGAARRFQDEARITGQLQHTLNGSRMSRRSSASVHGSPSPTT